MSLRNIGGAEQYIYNKLKFLRKKGFEVYIISAFDGNFLIKDFEEFKPYIIPAIMYPPKIFRLIEINKTLDKIIGWVGNQLDDCIIESNSIDAACWGELIGAKLNAKHFIFNLQEKHNYSPTQISFLKYKIERKELAGITSSSVGQMILKEEYEAKSEEFFEAYCTNVVEDIEDGFSPKLLKGARLNIGSIGRLEKEFLYKILLKLKVFFNDNKKDIFNLVLIGGSNKKVVTNIQKLFAGVKNVNLIITGYLYPIPKKLIDSCDLFISTAGSSYVSFNECVPTIQSHPFSGNISSILGYTQNKKDDMFVENDIDLIDTIKKIEHKDLDITFPVNRKEEYNDLMEKEFERQISIESKDRKQEYYDVTKVKPNYTKKNLFYFLFGKILGGYKFQTVMESIRRFNNFL